MQGSDKYRQPPLRDQSPDAKKARADASFQRREDQNVEAPKAMQEYRSAEKDRRDQLEKLRTERLAREASGE